MTMGLACSCLCIAMTSPTCDNQQQSGAEELSFPGTSKHAKKRAKEKEKEAEARSLASRVGRQGEIRVLNSGVAQDSQQGSRQGI